MRKMASIQKVTALYEIPNKQKIEVAQVLGWQVIVKKGEFVPGDHCVFHEIDCFLPMNSYYAFLGKTTKYLGKEGYRLKTMKMSGVLSQGLALPLKHFTETVLPNMVGSDVTDDLGIVKYDKETVESTRSGNVVIGAAGGKFPSFIPKTDQTRIQSLPMFFQQYKDVEFEETLKLDGSSCTMYKKNYEPTGFIAAVKRFFGIKTTVTHFGVCSRNLEIKRPSASNKKSDFWTAAVKYNIEETLPEGFAIQGEVIAPNIQKNWEKVSEVEYYIFDVFNINKQQYLLPEDRRVFVETRLPFAKHVPVVKDRVAILQLTQEEILNSVKGQSMNPGTISEGRVYKSLKHTNVTFKAISNDYLLRGGE